MSEPIRTLVYYALGISFGVAVAAGLFAFLVTVGVPTRLAAGTKTAKYRMLYESVAIGGVTVANVLDLYQFRLPNGMLWRLACGLSCGVFV